METRELTDMTAVLRSINDGNPSNAERWEVLALTMAAALVLTLSIAAHQANEAARWRYEAQGMGQTEIVTPQNQNTAVQP